ncbi:MAG TPA: EscU/YscU/HrcU family type III secretion system export apparatus switch protein [Alphaproteobacteria bacterium]|nr:EscU/YscU/HrcU family type III secretion system export apparatus switch protein [Alphaproteobacteria bacterium]
MTRPPIRRGPQPPDDQPRAVALQYQRHHDLAPRVVAKGEGELALKILELAREHGIAIKEDPDLAQLLSAVELETHIPVEAFVAVAEILAFIYRAKSEGPATRPTGALPR